jgi:hypothetical protein
MSGGAVVRNAVGLAGSIVGLVEVTLEGEDDGRGFIEEDSVEGRVRLVEDESEAVEIINSALMQLDSMLLEDRTHECLKWLL